MSPRDRYEEINNRVRWAKAMLDVMIADQDLQSIHTEAIGGIAGHLEDAMRGLEELYPDLPEQCAKKRTPSAPTLVSVRNAPADAEPEQGGAA
jgi:hypothetical protein